MIKYFALCLICLKYKKIPLFDIQTSDREGLETGQAKML